MRRFADAVESNREKLVELWKFDRPDEESIVRRLRWEYAKAKDKMAQAVQGDSGEDGQFGPDGFMFDGILVTGLTDAELALLTLALERKPMGPTEDDVCQLKAFQSFTRERIDKLLSNIKEKFLAEKSPRVLRWANKHIVFREPRPLAKASRKRAKSTKPKTGRK